MLFTFGTLANQEAFMKMSLQPYSSFCPQLRVRLACLDAAADVAFKPSLSGPAASFYLSVALPQ
eukprot:11697890-Ditylum_brightwellii.AAC.1